MRHLTRQMEGRYRSHNKALPAIAPYMVAFPRGIRNQAMWVVHLALGLAGLYAAIIACRCSGHNLGSGTQRHRAERAGAVFRFTCDLRPPAAVAGRGAYRRGRVQHRLWGHRLSCPASTCCGANPGHALQLAGGLGSGFSYWWAPVDLLLRHRMPTVEFVRGSLAPTALIIAKRDAIVPARRSAPLRQAIRNLVFEGAIDAGHNDLYDHPAFAAAVREALARIEAVSGEAPGR